MNLHIPINLLFALSAVFIMLAFALSISSADKRGRKTLSSVLTGLVLVGAWFGWLHVIKLVVGLLQG